MKFLQKTGLLFHQMEDMLDDSPCARKYVDLQEALNPDARTCDILNNYWANKVAPYVQLGRVGDTDEMRDARAVFVYGVHRGSMSNISEGGGVTRDNMVDIAYTAAFMTEWNEIASLRELSSECAALLHWQEPDQ